MSPKIEHKAIRNSIKAYELLRLPGIRHLAYLKLFRLMIITTILPQRP